eukprot:TRINITY_DN24566_c0_g1_i2.p1 TRINITY_DN24566_c0_g1~~TRINITY_DN24566_c0_g1_i2.p1  ORF type:complete len:570 (-),score=128.93 TRINITY_DN24566_c0_g1_i2:329-2038(-)
MQRQDLDFAAQLFENASDGADEERWGQRFEEHVEQTMRKHSRLLKAQDDSGRRLEVLRARLELHEIVMDRLLARAAQSDEGLADALSQLRDANAAILDEGFGSSQADDEQDGGLELDCTSAGLEGDGEIEDVVSAEDDCELPASSACLSSPLEALVQADPGQGVQAFAAAKKNMSANSISRDIERVISSNMGAYVQLPNLSSGSFSDWGSASRHYGTHADTRSHASEHGLAPSWVCKEGRSSTRKSYLHIHGTRCPHLASRPATELSLKQLKDIIQSVYTSKAEEDDRRREQKEPLKTLEQHLYQMLCDRYGMKHVVEEWSKGIFRSIQKFAKKDVEVLIFGKILQNSLSETFSTVQETLRGCVHDILRRRFVQRNPELSAADVDATWKLEARETGVLLSDCDEVVRYMYNEYDYAMIAKRLRYCAGKESDAMSVGAGYITYRTLLQTLMTFQLQLTEAFISDFVGIFRRVDQRGDGIIDNQCLVELVHRLAHLPEARQATKESIAHLMEAENNAIVAIRSQSQATFTEAVDLCTNVISMRWAALGESNKGPTVADDPRRQRKPQRWPN